jgi:hypothetical protein
MINKENNLESLSPTRREIKEQFLLQRYNIENLKLKNLNRNKNKYIKKYETPGPGKNIR